MFIFKTAYTKALRWWRKLQVFYNLIRFERILEYFSAEADQETHSALRDEAIPLHPAARTPRYKFNKLTTNQTSLKNTLDESSEDKFDEEELQRNFDDEASLIVQTDTLPKKSSERYLLVYDAYKDWQKEHAKSLSNSEEKNLIVYFSELKLKLKPTTLWSIWSMLKKTLATRDDVNINNFITLKSLIKNNSKGYKPTKSAVLKWDEIKKFMDEAPDIVYIGTKYIRKFD
ncbi:unnamed protein product [Trichogramma brassicae]|uniref:Uncharacterized protein n=1 Tax=Trichogramma brassicae TaxID=86971 RepID=A0A6H5I9V7_9HYME|nr:unnamed protein product [Trichogramma brassicae]